MSETYSDALVITFIAIGALIVISLFFIGLTRGLAWLASRGNQAGGGPPAAEEPESWPFPGSAPPVAPRVSSASVIEPPPAQVAAAEVLASPIPGTIISIRVRAGDVVKAGDVLLVLEIMNMHNEISAPRDGKIREVFVSQGKYVRRREPLVAIEG